MAVTFNQPVRIGQRSWRVSWTSDASDPTYYVYRDGALVQQSAAASIVLALEPGEQLWLEVYDAAPTDRPRYFAAAVRLQWQRCSVEVDYFRVDQYVGSSWVELQRIPDEGLEYVAFVTPQLADDTVHQFRMVPVGLDGNAGTAITFDHHMVRRPDVPAVGYAYDDETGELTISAA